MYVFAYAEQAARVGVNYTVYYGGFPGMTENDKVTGSANEPLHYRSSVGWRDKVTSLSVARAVPNSVDEHLLFMCHITGMTNSGPKGSPVLQETVLLQ